MLSSHFLDAHHVPETMQGQLNSQVSPVTAGRPAGGFSAAIAPPSPFQAVLDRLMSMPDPSDSFERERRQLASVDTQLLTMNPYVNIKAVMAAHPEQAVFYADGAIQIQQARAQSVLPPVSQAPGLSDPLALTQVVAPVLSDNKPFRQVVAATALSALAMGSGAQVAAKVTHPEHLNALLNRAVATPVGRLNAAYTVRNDHSFWDK